MRVPGNGVSATFCLALELLCVCILVGVISLLTVCIHLTVVAAVLLLGEVRDAPPSPESAIVVRVIL